MDIVHTTWASTALTFLGWFFGTFYFNGIGITLGYHRLLTHKSLKVPRWLMYIIVSGGYLCLMGAPITWVGVHRLHHQKSDVEGEDPHSPRDGFLHALYKWMLTMGEKQSDEELQKQCPDLMADPVLRWFGADHSAYQAQLCLGINIAVRILLLACFGWAAFAGSLLATIIVFWAPQLVNAVCHLPGHGYRNHETRDDSRNVWWVAMLSCGEGWHNNHHAMPKSAAHGMRWFEVDVTWYTILVLEKLGLATNVIRPPALGPLKAAKAKAPLEPTPVTELRMPKVELPKVELPNIDLQKAAMENPAAEAVLAAAEPMIKKKVPTS